jgi:hypothetical protein
VSTDLNAFILTLLHEAYFYRFLRGGKAGGWCQPSFFVRYLQNCTKVPYFFTHDTPIHHRSTIKTMSDGLQIIGPRPQEPSDTIDDAFPRPLPPLPLRPSILPWGKWNSLHDSTKMGRWQRVWPAFPHKMWWEGGTTELIGSLLFWIH